MIERGSLHAGLVGVGNVTHPHFKLRNRAQNERFQSSFVVAE